MSVAFDLQIRNSFFERLTQHQTMKSVILRTKRGTNRFKKQTGVQEGFRDSLVVAFSDYLKHIKRTLRYESNDSRPEITKLEVNFYAISHDFIMHFIYMARSELWYGLA